MNDLMIMIVMIGLVISAYITTRVSEIYDKESTNFLTTIFSAVTFLISLFFTIAFCYFLMVYLSGIEETQNTVKYSDY